MHLGHILTSPFHSWSKSLSASSVPLCKTRTYNNKTCPAGLLGASYEVMRVMCITPKLFQLLLLLLRTNHRNRVYSIFKLLCWLPSSEVEVFISVLIFLLPLRKEVCLMLLHGYESTAHGGVMWAAARHCVFVWSFSDVTLEKFSLRSFCWEWFPSH